MNGTPLHFPNPISDAISRVRFAPHSDNLLISSWDSCLRLYDVGCSELRLEAFSEYPLLDCCFQEESLAFSSGSDGSITRYDLHLGTSEVIGDHDDLSTCIGYSDETCQVIVTGLHKKVLSWDTRMKKDLLCLVNVGLEVDSMSVSGFDIILAVGTSVYMYDLRKLSRPVQSNKSDMDSRIKCVSSIPHRKGFAVGSVDGHVALEMSFSSNSDDISYIFRCHPKSTDKNLHLVSVNDIVFNPLIDSAFFTGDNEGYVSAWNAQSKKRILEVSSIENCS